MEILTIITILIGLALQGVGLTIPISKYFRTWKNIVWEKELKDLESKLEETPEDKRLFDKYQYVSCIHCASLHI